MSRPILDRELTDSPLVLSPFSDAATAAGTGGGAHLLVGERLLYFQFKWSKEEQELIPREYDGTRGSVEKGKPLVIYRLEFFLMAAAVMLFAGFTQGRRVALLLRGDNDPAVNVIRRGRSRLDPVVAIMHQELVEFSAKRGIEFSAQHVAGVDNELADALSRFEHDRVRELIEASGAHVATRVQVGATSQARTLLMRAYKRFSASR